MTYQLQQEKSFRKLQRGFSISVQRDGKCTKKCTTVHPMTQNYFRSKTWTSKQIKCCHILRRSLAYSALWKQHTRCKQASLQWYLKYYNLIYCSIIIVHYTFQKWFVCFLWITWQKTTPDILLHLIFSCKENLRGEISENMQLEQFKFTAFEEFVQLYVNYFFMLHKNAWFLCFNVWGKRSLFWT